MESVKVGTLIILTSTLSFFLLMASSHANRSRSNPPPKVIKGGYYPSWTNMAPADINANYFTHVFYAFLIPNNVNFTFTIDATLADSLRNFTSAIKAKNPPIEPLFSIGGGGAGATLFSRMASTFSTRAAFINSTIYVARAYGFCGMDLDYEFPQNPTDMANLALLLHEWRQAVKVEAHRTRQAQLLLTAAVYYSAGPFLSGAWRVYPAGAIKDNLDWVNMMDYDYHGSWDTSATGAHAQLYDPTGGNLSTSYGIISWMRAGVPANMLVMGLPLYGRTWMLKDASQTGIGAPAKGVGPGDEGTMTYARVVNFNRNNNATEVFDNKTVSVYSVAGENWIGYDDVRSVTGKIQFAKKQKLAGYFFWALSYDDQWTISRNASESWKAAARQTGLQ